MTDGLDQLSFLDNLNQDFADYYDSLPPGEKATSKKLIKYLKEIKRWIDEDITIV